MTSTRALKVASTFFILNDLSSNLYNTTIFHMLLVTQMYVQFYSFISCNLGCFYEDKLTHAAVLDYVLYHVQKCLTRKQKDSSSLIYEGPHKIHHNG